MILAGWALFGFIQVTNGIWEDIDWYSVLILYGSIIPLCIWTTWIVMTTLESIKVDKVDSLKY